MAMGMIDGRVYLFGGSVAEHAGDVVIFDPAAGSWAVGAPMPMAASYVAVASLDGVAYLFGGRRAPT